MPHAHLVALRKRHEHIEKMIVEESRHPSRDDRHIRALKEKKLHVREEIERFSKTTH
jgi:hypothetical protein